MCEGADKEKEKWEQRKAEAAGEERGSEQEKWCSLWEPGAENVDLECLYCKPLSLSKTTGQLLSASCMPAHMFVCFIIILKYHLLFMKHF